ncbi:MAG TPA: integrin alpha, partial [Polyangiales bacterium]|nr:integrin alpha [Polyangiales bacterium]
FVDCSGSDCSIGSPIPFSGKDASGDPAFYLNRSMLNGKGFDFRVDSDSGVLGRQVQLIIDQHETNAPSAEAEPNGNKVSATFDDVVLTAGPHTIEARCRDASGNVTKSGESTWVVDTSACEIDIQQPAPDTIFLPGDDVDNDLDNGIQISTVSAITGGDCIVARAAICDPTDGIASGAWSELDGDELRDDVKLQTDAEQTLCVEARDLADNLGRSSVKLKFRAVLPNVRIESPEDETSFNAAGNEGLVMDSEPGTPACNADFRVLCSELGAMLQLRRDDEHGDVVATGTCEARADGDPELPEGFRGRAKLADVAFLAIGKHEATLVATQVVQGSSQSLVGTSEPITLTGWCEAPPITLYPGCPAEQVKLPNSGNAQVNSLTAIYIGEVVAEAPMSAKLTVTGAGGSEITSKTVVLSGDRYVFGSVSLGNTEQAVETKVTLTDTFSNTTVMTCATMVVSDLPTLRITSPVGGAFLAPAASCDPGVSDKYGLQLALTLDQAAMRELSYSVNSGSSVSLPITGTSMMPCIPVNDGANSVSVLLKSTSGVGMAKASVNVTANALEIVTPVPNSTLVAADDACDAGFGAHVVADVAPAFEGTAATVSSGATQVTAAVSGGEIDTCLPLPAGTSTFTVSLDGKSISRSAIVTVATGNPTSAIALTTVTQPPDNAYRSGSVMLGWATPTQDYAGQLKAYELRCGTTTIAASASDSDKNNWWNAARQVALPGNVVPPTNSAAISVRTGDAQHCVLRAKDGANQLTPIPDSTAVNHPFREQQVSVSDLNRMGYSLASVGDVNHDGVNDVLVGGSGRAYLYFGNSAGLGAKPNKASPDVTFRGSPGIAEFDFGSRVAALGDINGDGENDFAISHPTWSATSPSLGQTGAAYVFYGRKAGDSWPTSIDLTGTNASACAADVCFYGEVANEFLGFGLAPAGDFNNDGKPDIALSATGRAIPGDSLAGRQYVLLGRAFEGSGSRSGSFWNVTIHLPSGDPPGFYVDGVGFVGSDATSNSQLGSAVAPVGNIDGMAGADLLISSLGRSATSISAKLFFLSGRSHNGSAPQLKSIANSELVFKASGTTNNFAARLSPLRNFYDGSQSGVVDVAVFEATGDTFYVYLGDLNGSSVRFANDTRLTVQGPSSSVFADGGLGASRGYNPNIGGVSRSDIDGDGLDDLCIGSGAGARPISIFYGADVDEALSGNTLSYTAASQVQLATRPGTVARSVQPVGDITGDGAIDLVVGDPDANSNAGGITVLY